MIPTDAAPSSAPSPAGGQRPSSRRDITRAGLTHIPFGFILGADLLVRRLPGFSLRWAGLPSSARSFFSPPLAWVLAGSSSTRDGLPPSLRRIPWFSLGATRCIGGLDHLRVYVGVSEPGVLARPEALWNIPSPWPWMIVSTAASVILGTMGLIQPGASALAHTIPPSRPRLTAPRCRRRLPRPHHPGLIMVSMTIEPAACCRAWLHRCQRARDESQPSGLATTRCVHVNCVPLPVIQDVERKHPWCACRQKKPPNQRVLFHHARAKPGRPCPQCRQFFLPESHHGAEEPDHLRRLVVAKLARGAVLRRGPASFGLFHLLRMRARP